MQILRLPRVNMMMSYEYYCCCRLHRQTEIKKTLLTCPEISKIIYTDHDRVRIDDVLLLLILVVLRVLCPRCEKLTKEKGWNGEPIYFLCWGPISLRTGTYSQQAVYTIVLRSSLKHVLLLTMIMRTGSVIHPEIGCLWMTFVPASK